jgi:hypothetical protein
LGGRLVEKLGRQLNSVAYRSAEVDEEVRKANGEREFVIVRDEGMGSYCRLDVLLVEDDNVVVLNDGSGNEEAAAILSNDEFSSMSVGIRTRVRTERRRHLSLMQSQDLLKVALSEGQSCA